MTSPTNWPRPDNDPDLYQRHLEKNIMNEQRRPQVSKASDILGPGFAPLAIPLVDWDADEAAFNGYFWSDVMALNTPDGGVATNQYLGISVSTGVMGIQQAWDAATAAEWKRVWSVISGVRVYTAWA